MLIWELLGQACLPLKSTSRFLGWLVSISPDSIVWNCFYCRGLVVVAIYVKTELSCGASSLRWCTVLIGSAAVTCESQCLPAPLLPLLSWSFLMFFSFVMFLLIFVLCCCLHFKTVSETSCILILPYMLRSYDIVYIKEVCGFLLTQLLSPRCESSSACRRPGHHYHGVFPMMPPVQSWDCFFPT